MSHVTQTPLSRSKGQRSTCRRRGHIVAASLTACCWCFLLVYLVMACAGGATMIYQLSGDLTSGNLFSRVWQGPPTKDFYPVLIAQPQPAGTLIIVAEAAVSSDRDAVHSSTIWQMSSLGTSDFVPRSAFRSTTVFCNDFWAYMKR